MKKNYLIIFSLTLLMAQSCSMAPESDTHYTTFILNINNQTQDTLTFVPDFSNSLLLPPGDTTPTRLTVSTELSLSKDSKTAVFQDLMTNFSGRSFDTCYVHNLLDVSNTVKFRIRWNEPFVDVPADSIHSFFNVQSWEMLYNIKGWNILMLTITDADKASSIL
jgi:hypothetical protein